MKKILQFLHGMQNRTFEMSFRNGLNSIKISIILEYERGRYVVMGTDEITKKKGGNYVCKEIY